MGRWTGSWLSGPAAAGEAPPRAGQDWWGQRLGLPERGPDSVASFGRRLAAYAVDSVVANLVAVALTPPSDDPTTRGLVTLGVLAASYLLLVGVVGQTLGMRLLGLRVAPLQGGGGASRRVPGLYRSLVRTALLFLLVPALVWDADNRGLHDKAVGTAVLRTR
ncbi:MAG TPA: RDD family protein [Miltoncostaeaceae bacterium]|nr:RDD family protein [Miltoncostaeaceae bacterium]